MKKRKLNSSSRIEFALNNHVDLRVRHDHPLDENEIAKLNEIYNLSLLSLDAALHEVKMLHKKMHILHGHVKIPEDFIHRHQYMFDMLKGHFKIGSDLHVRRFATLLVKLRNKLQAMRDGLYAENQPLVLSNISKRMAEKHQSFVGCLLGGYIRPGIDRIYLNLDNLDFLPEILCHTLIHEASHKFVDAKDFDGTYYHDLHYDNALDGIVHFLQWYTGSYDKIDKLGTNYRLDHADSLANFVADAAKPFLRTQSDEKKKQAYPDRELIKSDHSKLFSVKKPISKLAVAATVVNTVAGIAVVAELGYIACKLI